MLNQDRSKLSKRQGDVAVEEYKSKGYLPEALVNFVALLGWTPGDEREIFSMEQLVHEFSLGRVGKSGAVFNVEKLNWISQQHIRSAADAVIVALLKPYLRSSHAERFDDGYLLNVVRL